MNNPYNVSDFDALEAEQLKEIGIARARSKRPELLEKAREHARRAAVSGDGYATADDAYKGLMMEGIAPEELGHSAGGLFRSPQWKRAGRVYSKRTTNHRREITIWRYVG